MNTTAQHGTRHSTARVRVRFIILRGREYARYDIIEAYSPSTTPTQPTAGAAFTHACALTGTVDERAFLDKLAVEDWIWIRLVKQLDEFSDSYQVTANVANVLLNPFRQMAAQLAARFQDHACTRTKKVVGRGGRVRDDSR